jgi:hypothetical protein
MVLSKEQNVSDLQSKIAEGKKIMLQAALEILREDAEATDVASDAAGKVGTAFAGHDVDLYYDLADYQRHLTHEAKEVLDREKAKKANDEQELVSDLEKASVPQEKIDEGVFLMKVAALSVFKEKGSHARPAATRAARNALDMFTEGNRILRAVLLDRTEEAVVSALSEIALNRNIRGYHRSRSRS